MKYFKILVAIALTLALLGCATERKQLTQVQQLQFRVSELETELHQKNEDIIYLEEQLKEMQRLRISSSETLGTKEPKNKAFKISSRNIQRALKNAGFHIGPIDGTIGKGTKKAIKEFQKEKGLIADGIVGKQTWSKLKKYLD